MDHQHYFTSASTSKQSSVPITSISSNSENEQLFSDSVSFEPPPKIKPFQQSQLQSEVKVQASSNVQQDVKRYSLAAI